MFGAVCVAGYTYLQISNYYSALDATREWARVTDFPSSATNIGVDITGSMFTRGFVVTFDAPIADVDNWLAKSPGTSAIAPTIINGIRKYEIQPGGGAQFAEIEVDENKRSVRIRTYWS